MALLFDLPAGAETCGDCGGGWRGTLSGKRGARGDDNVAAAGGTYATVVCEGDVVLARQPNWLCAAHRPGAPSARVISGFELPRTRNPAASAEKRSPMNNSRGLQVAARLSGALLDVPSPVAVPNGTRTRHARLDGVTRRHREPPARRPCGTDTNRRP